MCILARPGKPLCEVTDNFESKKYALYLLGKRKKSHIIVRVLALVWLMDSLLLIALLNITPQKLLL